MKLCLQKAQRRKIERAQRAAERRAKSGKLKAVEKRRVQGFRGVWTAEDAYEKDKNEAI